MRVLLADGGRHQHNHGYGRVARSIVAALSADPRIQAVALAKAAAPTKDEPDPYAAITGREKLFVCADPKKASADLVVQVGPPSSLRPMQHPAVAYTMIDVHGVPKGWVEKLSGQRGIITPSTTSAASFARDVHVPIAVAPLYVEPQPFKMRRHWRAEGRKRMSFLFVGTFSYRKNVATLLDAFVAEFAPEEAGLTLIASESEPDTVFAGTLNAMRRAGRVADVEVVTKRLSDAWLARYYARHDAFVTMTRGEGWGYPAMEAAFCGIPVVAPDGTSMDDFLAAGSTVLAPTQAAPVDTIANPSGQNFKTQYAGRDCTMREVSVVAARKALRQAFDNRDALYQEAERNAALFPRIYNADAFRETFVTSLLSMAARPAARPANVA
ncbi:MAG: glycosyltransferase [Devosia sp.]